MSAQTTQPHSPLTFFTHCGIGSTFGLQTNRSTLKVNGYESTFSPSRSGISRFFNCRSRIREAEVDHLINSLSTICDQNGVRSRGGVYAIRNLLTLSPVIRVLACSLTVRSIAEEALWSTALPGSRDSV